MTKLVWLRLSVAGICLFVAVACNSTPGDPNDGVVVAEQRVQVIANGSTRDDDSFIGLTRRNQHYYRASK